jgi:hypothetical protein
VRCFVYKDLRVDIRIVWEDDWELQLWQCDCEWNRIVLVLLGLEF